MATTISRYGFTDDTGDGESGDVINAALIGLAIYDKIDAIFAAAAKAQVYHSTTQSLLNATYTAILFDSEDHDTFGMHSTSVNTSRLTIPAGGDGIYLVGGAVFYDGNATGVRVARLRKNGTTDIGSATLVAAVLSGTGAGPIVQATCLASLVAGDYVELLGYQDSGGALNVGNAARLAANQLWATRVL
jgi:hypothetical protein